MITSCLLLMQGCMKDSMADCGLSVRVQYTRNKDGVDLLENIDRLTLYVFDAEGTFVGEFPSTGTLYNGFTMPLSLKSGTYTFVVWGGNLDDTYQLPSFVQGRTKQNDEAVLLKNVAADNTITEFPTSLYYGTLSNVTIKPSLQRDQIFTINLIKDTKNVNVTATGLPMETRAESFACNIYSRNFGLRFDNLVTGTNEVKYIPHSTINEENQLVSQFVILREISDKSTHSQLVFTRTQNNGIESEIYRQSLIDLILALLVRSGNADLDIEDEFNIEVAFVFGEYVTASVTINGWTYDEVQYPL
jgi:hypothetical protein